MSTEACVVFVIHILWMKHMHNSWSQLFLQLIIISSRLKENPAINNLFKFKNPMLNAPVLMVSLKLGTVETIHALDGWLHGRTWKWLCYVLPPNKNWWPFCCEHLQRQIMYQNDEISKRNWLKPLSSALSISNFKKTVKIA